MRGIRIFDLINKLIIIIMQVIRTIFMKVKYSKEQSVFVKIYSSYRAQRLFLPISKCHYDT